MRTRRAERITRTRMLMGYAWDVGEHAPAGPVAWLRWNKRVYTESGQLDSTQSDARTGTRTKDRQKTPPGHDHYFGRSPSAIGQCYRLLPSVVYFG